MGTCPSKKNTATQLLNEKGLISNDYNERDFTVFHATTAVNAASIIKSGFRIPDAHEGAERGLKAGAAAYFGFNKEYCIHEAVNSIEDKEREQNMPPRSRRLMRESVVCLKVRVKLSRALVFSDYDKGCKGKGMWPIEQCTKLPSGQAYNGNKLTARQWDHETERLSQITNKKRRFFLFIDTAIHVQVLGNFKGKVQIQYFKSNAPGLVHDLWCL